MYTVIFFTIFILSEISSSVGLTKIADNNWVGTIFALILFGIWIPKRRKVNQSEIQALNQKSLVIFTSVAVLIPVLEELSLRNGVAIPKASINPLFYLLVILFLAGISVASSLVIINKRSEILDPITEVSEYRNHWQENVHPKDIFISFDMEMAKHCYKDIPNRVYLEVQPRLNMEGSMDKGSFSGVGIQEIQPSHEKLDYPDIFKQLRFYISVYGHSLVCISALLLFILNIHTSYMLSIKVIFDSLYIPIIIWIFGTQSIKISHLCWAEMYFKSNLIYLHGEGTYTESTITVGKAITDSNESRNTLVRTSFTPWIIVTEILTSTFAGIGPQCLDGARYILNMRKADAFLDNIVNGLRTHLEGRKIIAEPNAQDLNAIGNFNYINQMLSVNKQLQNNGLAVAATATTKEE